MISVNNSFLLTIWGVSFHIFAFEGSSERYGISLDGYGKLLLCYFAEIKSSYYDLPRLQWYYASGS